MRPPEWVWILLAIPTIGSVAYGVALVAVVGLRDWRWRREQRRQPPAQVVQLRPGMNGGRRRRGGGKR